MPATCHLTNDIDAMIAATPEQWEAIKPQLDAYEVAQAARLQAITAADKLRRELANLTRNRATSEDKWYCFRFLIAAFRVELEAHRAMKAASKIATAALDSLIREVEATKGGSK